MSRTWPCREDGCERARVEGAVWCPEHLDVRRRCKATKPGSDGVRCRKAALPGLEVCERHGGQSKQSRMASQRAVVLTDMQRFVRPYEGDLDPVLGFERELRRTLGRIEWYEVEISKLQVEDLTWGRTKEEVTSAGEFPGRTTTREARVNMYEELMMRERKHWLDLEKLWIAAKLDGAKLSLMRSYLTDARRGIVSAFEALGIDVTDPRVAAIIEQAFNPDAPKVEVLEIESRNP